MIETPSIEIYRLDISGAEFDRIAVIDNAYSNLTYSNIKNKLGGCSFGLNIFSPYARRSFLRPWQCQIAIRYGNKIDWFGPISNVSGDFSGAEGMVKIEALGYGAHLYARTLDTLTQFTGGDTYGEIVWDIIDTVQSRTNGELLLKDGTDTTSTTHEKTYEEAAVIGEKVYGVTELQGGPAQILFTPTTNADGTVKDVNVDRYQLRGRTRDDLPTLQLQDNPLGGNVQTISFSTRDELFNTLTSLGEGTGDARLSDTASDATSQLTYTRREKYTTYQDISVLDTLENKTTKDLADKKDLMFKYNIKLAPDVSPKLGEFIIGDTLNYDFTVLNNEGEASYLDQSGTVEITAISVSVDDTGVPYVVPTIEI